MTGRTNKKRIDITISQAVIALIIFLAVQLVTSLVVAFVMGTFKLPDTEMTSIASGLAALINSVVLVLMMRRRDVDLFDKSWGIIYGRAGGAMSGGRVLAAVFGTVLLAVCANICMNGVVQLSGIMQIDPLYQRVAGAITEGSYGMQLLVFGVLVPVAEEIAFRGVLYRAVRERMGTTTVAILVSSLVFAVYHGNFTQGLYALLVGVLLCVACEAGGLIFSVLLHVGLNLVSLIGNHVEAYTRILTNPNDHWIVFAGTGLLTVLAAVVLLRILLFDRPSR